MQGSCLECISSWERRKQQGLSRGKGLDSPPQLCPPGSGWEEGQPDSAGGLWGQSVLGLEERMGIIGMEWELSGWNGNYWDVLWCTLEEEVTGAPSCCFPPQGSPGMGWEPCESSQGSVSSIPCSLTAPHAPSILRQCTEVN